MADHNQLGKAGEEEAARYLQKKGYAILHRNWHCGKKELDIVARKNEELIVVEVKTRRNTDYAKPEEAVDEKKIRRIVSAADVYLKKYALDLPVRFDIITVTGQETEAFTIEHIPEAFYPPIW